MTAKLLWLSLTLPVADYQAGWGGEPRWLTVSLSGCVEAVEAKQEKQGRWAADGEVHRHGDRKSVV